ncbi:ABC transporter permease [Alkaliphilus peptidifermentans]|uniref:ABC transporter permease n=1 Tax=Alkaliphilus peptidifermentans TaxID=426129 RepID=UPI000B8A168B|nr:ABC transporter permease [Alkaliphilus peptidifermentans]
MEFEAILWEEWIVFKRKFWNITASAMISPLLYMVAFGWGLGKDMYINGHPYINFIVPGIVAMATMNTSYSAVAVLLNIHRLYDKTFEQYLIAPLPIYKYVLGKVLAGSFRGMYAGFIILTIAFLAGVKIKVTFIFVFIMFLNGLAFASLGFYAALVVDSHADMNRFSTYVLLPMTFLCGTFFSLENMPPTIQKVIYLLPLTHASRGLRSIALETPFNWVNILVLSVFFTLLFSLAIRQCYKVTA